MRRRKGAFVLRSGSKPDGVKMPQAVAAGRADSLARKSAGGGLNSRK
jgi:hypothetical protein